MKQNLIVVALFMSLIVASCRQADVRTVAIYVPGMKSQACADLILKALNTEQGIIPAQVNVRLEAHTLEIRFDSLKHALKNIEITIADAGFDANDIPANGPVRDALPEGCR